MERHWEIWNNSDLRRAYETLRFCEKFRNEVENPKVFDRVVVNIKKGIREYLGMKASFNSERRLVKDEGIDGFIELIELGDGFEDQADAEEYFEENYYRECMQSMYDCTGQLFTAWYKVFQRHGQWMAYHSVARDV